MVVRRQLSVCRAGRSILLVRATLEMSRFEEKHAQKPRRLSNRVSLPESPKLYYTTLYYIILYYTLLYSNTLVEKPNRIPGPAAGLAAVRTSRLRHPRDPRRPQRVLLLLSLLSVSVVVLVLNVSIRITIIECDRRG